MKKAFEKMTSSKQSLTIVERKVLLSSSMIRSRQMIMHMTTSSHFSKIFELHLLIEILMTSNAISTSRL